MSKTTSARKPDCLCISYCPLLYADPLKIYQKKDMDHLPKIPEVKVDGCVWHLIDGTPTPSFLIRKAHKIVEHMLFWSEGRPDQWFKLYVGEHSGRYAICLFPDLVRSLERMQQIHDLQLTATHLIYRPLCFISQKDQQSVDLKQLLTTKIGFIDRNGVSIRKLSKHDQNSLDAEYVGPFTVCDEPHMRDYVIQMMG